MKHILSIGILCLLAACSPKENQKTFVYEGNPLVRNNFTADPAALVHGDRLYLYVGHDEYYAGQDTASGGREFNITEWLCYSTTDMKNWTEHGAVLSPADFKWQWRSVGFSCDRKRWKVLLLYHGAGRRTLCGQSH